MHIVSHHEIQFAVAVIVDPCRAGGKLGRSPESGRLGGVGEGTVAIVVEEVVLAHRSYENIVETVVVIVPNGYAQPEHGDTECRFTRHIGKCAVAIVVEKFQGRRSAVRMAREIFAVDQNDVGVSVVVIIDKGAAWTHGFRQPFFPEGAVVVREMDSGLSSNVAKMDLLSK